jgi:hypothetical protein
LGNIVAYYLHAVALTDMNEYYYMATQSDWLLTGQHFPAIRNFYCPVRRTITKGFKNE